VKIRMLNEPLSNNLVLKRRTGEFIFSVLRWALIIGLLYLFLFPILYMLLTAFQSVDSASDPTVVWIPRSISLDGIKGALKYLNYWKSISETLIITIGSTLAMLVSCSMAGYGLARYRFKGRNLSLALAILIIVIPPQLLYPSTYVIYRFFDFSGFLSLFGVSFNLLNTPWTFILPSIFGVGLRGGLFIYLFCQFFSGLPKELEESAKLDGCGHFRTFVNIMAPLAKPAFVTVILFSMVWHWSDYYSASTYYNGELKPLVVMLSKLASILRTDGVLATGESVFSIRMYLQAGAMLTIAPPMLVYIFAQRQFVESIERTGLVG